MSAQEERGLVVLRAKAVDVTRICRGIASSEPLRQRRVQLDLMGFHREEDVLTRCEV